MLVNKLDITPNRNARKYDLVASLLIEESPNSFKTCYVEFSSYGAAQDDLDFMRVKPGGNLKLEADTALALMDSLRAYGKFYRKMKTERTS